MTDTTRRANTATPRTAPSPTDPLRTDQACTAQAVTAQTNTAQARAARAIGRSSALLTMAVAGILAWTPALPAHAEDPPTTGAMVTSALADAVGATATEDDSSVTGCMAANPEPLAYRNDRIVLRTNLSEADAQARVQAVLGGLAQVSRSERIDFPAPPSGDPVTPVVVVWFDVTPGEPVVDIVRLARTLRGSPHLLTASPDYLYSPSNSGPTGLWPNGFPQPTADPAPGRTNTLGMGITIAVYDTGLPQQEMGNWPPNVTRLTSADVEQPDVVAPLGVADIYSVGHELGIASVIATMAPAASVKAIRITDDSGVATDVSATRRMARTLREANQAGAWPDLIVAAFGSSACLAGPNFPGKEMVPLGLEAVTDAIDRHDQALVVASAGNRGTSQPFYPAAFSSVVGVGALDATADGDASAWTAPLRSAPPADFSNFGPWVKAWAPGVDFSVNHVIGLAFEENGPVINGQALVSGTSFAAPYLVSLLAEQMASTAATANDAWSAIKASGYRCHDVGGGVAVSLTTLTSTPTAGPLPLPGMGTC